MEVFQNRRYYLDVCFGGRELIKIRDYSVVFNGYGWLLIYKIIDVRGGVRVQLGRSKEFLFYIV